LLALLLLNANRAVSRDQLIDELVVDGASDHADHALHVQISRLRKTLAVCPDGAEKIAAKPPGYLLHVRPGELDLHQFEELVAEGRLALESDELARAAETFRAAELLWRGRPLADLEFEPFAKLEIERLEELRLVVVEERIDAELALGHHARLVPELERLVAEHPLRERLRGQQMLALYRSGRQVAALETFRAARALLNDELGLDPSPQLRELERAILRHEDAGGTKATSRAPTPVAARSVARLRPRLSGRWLIASAGVLLIAGAVAAAAFVGDSRPAPRTLREVPPNSIGVIDAKTNRLVDAIPIGGRVSGIAYGTGSVWVADYDGQTLERIDPSTARIVDSFALPSKPTDIAFGPREVWVASAPAGLLVRVDPRYGTIDRRIHLHQAAWNDGTPCSDAPMAVGRHGLWIGHDVSALSHIDPERGTPVRQLILDAPVGSVADAADDVWVATSAGPYLSAVNPISNAIDGRTRVPGPGDVIAVGEHAVWVASWLTNKVWRIDPDPRNPNPTAIIQVGHGPSGIAVGAGAVWVANSLAGTVERIDPRTDRVVNTIHVGNNPEALTVAGNRIWVTVSPSWQGLACY
jgi:YVTN family beta-propeller protein